MGPVLALLNEFRGDKERKEYSRQSIGNLEQAAGVKSSGQKSGRVEEPNQIGQSPADEFKDNQRTSENSADHKDFFFGRLIHLPLSF